MKKLLIIPDAHFPFHSKRSWNLVCEAGSHFRPDVLVNLGDCYDFNAVKSHRKSPKLAKDRMLLSEELAKSKSARTDMEAIGAKQNIFIVGNHCDRLDRYIDDNCPDLAGILSVRELLGYQKWTWVPYREHIRIGKVYFTHDVGHAGAGATRQTQAAFEGNVVIGHTHRMDYLIKGNAVGKAHVGASFGWLGDPKQADYMYQIKVNREWSHGFGIGYLDTDTMFLVPVPIVNGKCQVEGKVFKS